MDKSHLLFRWAKTFAFPTQYKEWVPNGPVVETINTSF